MVVDLGYVDHVVLRRVSCAAEENKFAKKRLPAYRVREMDIMISNGYGAWARKASDGSCSNIIYFSPWIVCPPGLLAVASLYRGLLPPLLLLLLFREPNRQNPRHRQDVYTCGQQIISRNLTSHGGIDSKAALLL